MDKIKKKLKLIYTFFAILLVLAPIVYKNIISPNDTPEAIETLSKISFPIMMLFSFVLMWNKRRVERKEEKKNSNITENDINVFYNIGSPEDYRPQK